MLIPNSIDSNASTGEKILFLKFRKDPSIDNMHVLHSLFTNYHLKNISGELDFLVIAPKHGIFAIEVKHGGVRRKDGWWYYTNYKNETTKNKKSPFAQVDGTMNSIRKFVLNKVKKDKKLYQRMSKILWGTGVAFTSMDGYSDFGPEAHPWQILDKNGLGIPIGYYISTLSRGCHENSKGKYWYDVNLSRPSVKECKLLVEILRGDFDCDYSEINKILENDLLINEFTEEQFALLDFTKYNERCLITGAAGTGKTLMALELAGRELNKKTKIGMFCYNKELGKKLNYSIRKHPSYEENNIYCGTFHSFMISSIGLETSFKVDDNFYDEELPIEFLVANEGVQEEEKFDIIIIDESQDLISSFYLEVMDSVLKGGIKNGKWIFFGDFNNQAIYLNNPSEILEILSFKTSFTKFPPLKINCRNTKLIAKQNTLLTGIEEPIYRLQSIQGDAIIPKFPSNGKQMDQVEEIITELLNSGVPGERITILSPKKFKNTFMSDSKLFQESTHGILATTIQSYKGLENSVIILYDFEEIISGVMQKLLYVGISRAKQKLYIILKKSLKPDYEKLLTENINKLM